MLLFCLLATVVTATPPLVDLHAGTIRGGYSSDEKTSVFRSIPYAEPPTESLRFLPPKPYTKSYPPSALDATRPASPCLQFPSSFHGTTGSPAEDWYVLVSRRLF